MRAREWLSVLGKAIIIGVLAAVAAVAFVALIGLFIEPGPDSYMDHWEGWAVLTSFALFGSLSIGLPIALLTFWLAGSQLIQFPSLVPQITFLAGIMLSLASYALAGEGALVLFGAPAFVAAITYGALGWLWILKPLRQGVLDHD